MHIPPIRARSAICAALLVALTACGAGAQELLRNGDFEGGFYTHANGSVANYWEPCARPDFTGVNFSSASYTGLGYYQKIVPNSYGRDAGICQRVTGLTPGAMVKFSAVVYQKAESCTVWMAIDPNNSLPPNSLPVRTIQVPYHPGDWTYREITATVGPGGAVAVYVWGYQQTADIRHINVNDCSLVYVDPTIRNLTVTSTLTDAVKLDWTATVGASKYEIRYSTQPITSANWSSATVVTSQVPPVPATSGTAQSSWVRGLSPSTTYYFAIKVRDGSGTWSNVSNSPSATTLAAGVAPYWAWRQKEGLGAWYSKVLAECQAADRNSGPTADNPNDPFSWYFYGWDPDCEHNPPISALLQIVRDPYILGFLGKLCDHLWEIGYANTCIDKNIYNATRQKVPIWNESHHGGERSWAGVTITALDYDNPKWVQRLTEYARHLHYWTGYAGSPPHLHFKSFWFKGDEWNHSAERGSASLVDNPEDRRLTRALEYAAWRDPSTQMLSGQTIKDFLYELDHASAEDCMSTALGKPVGFWPGEIRFNTHQIGGYSGSWWRMAGSMGGTPGTSGEWWWDWRYGWVQARDAYYELVDRYVVTGEDRFIIPVREMLRYFSVTAAVNNIPPQYLGDPPSSPWPDYNDPWGGYQYIVNYLYRQYTGDTQFDQAWLGHANVIKQIMPAPGAPRYHDVWRSTLAWDTSKAPVDITPQNPFFLAWVITKDKEWLCRALDEMAPGDQFQITWYQAMYNGMPNTNLNRLPDQPITWNETTGFANFAALVTDWSPAHVRWLTCNFGASPKSMPIWLWSLKPGEYVLRHGPDADGDDAMDYVVETVPFTYSQRRTPLTLNLPAGRVEAWEIVPVERTLAQVRALADGSPVYLSDATVTAVFDGFFYVENDSRTTGMRVDSLAAVSVGDRVSLSGYLATVSGERRLKCLTDALRIIN